MVIAFYVFDVDHQVRSFFYPPVHRVKTDITSPLNLFFSLKKFYLYLRRADPLNILMVFHWLVLVCQCLACSDNPKILYDVLNLVSKCQRRRNKHSFWPTDYTIEVSLHWCKGTLLIYAQFLSTETTMSFIQNYFPATQPQACTVAWSNSASGETMHSFLLSCVSSS